MSEDIRLYKSEKSGKIIEYIDNTNFLNLGKGSIERIELYVFALSFGLDSPTKLEKASDFVKQEHARQYNALIYSAYIGSKADFQINDIVNKKEIYTYADQLANTGFAILEGKLSKKEGTVALELIKEMDEIYNKAFLGKI